MPRIDMISEKTQISEDRHDEFDAIVNTLHGVRGPFSILMHSPGLAQKVMEAGAQVRLNSTLSPVEREIAIIAVAREKDATYEWAAHVKTGRTAGMAEEVIDVIRYGLDSRELDEIEQGIIEFVRQLLRENKVEQRLFDSLSAEKGVRWIVELTATIGQYQYISAINNAFGVVAGPDGDQLQVPI